MLRTLVRPLESERSLAIVGVLGLVLSAACAIVMWIRGSSFIPPEADLTKAITFNGAVGIYVLTLALYAPLASFTPRGRTRWRGWTIGLTLYGYSIETIQAFRGLDPRFSRFGTLADGVLGGLFFLSAVGLIVTFIILATKLFSGPAREKAPLLLLGMQYGSATTMLAFAAGLWMSAVQGRLTGESGNILPLHALGFHGLQAVPLIALMLERSQLTYGLARRWVHVAGIAWLGATTAVAVQTAMGRSVTEMSTLPVLGELLLLVWLVAAGKSLWSWRRGRALEQFPAGQGSIVR